MKLISLIACLFFSIPALACLDFSGAFVKPVQEDGPNYLNLSVLKQDKCARLDIHDASIYVPTGLYMENPNSTSYKIDSKEHCNGLGFCYTAVIDDKSVSIAHTPKEFAKSNGDKCFSGKVSFVLDQTQSLEVTRDCADATTIKTTYKKY